MMVLAKCELLTVDVFCGRGVMLWQAVVSLACLAAATGAGAQGQPPPPPPGGGLAAPSRTLAPCQACRLFAGSFRAGLQRTARGKFEGGDAAWEEEKLGSYARSEVRLVEIQEKLCSELKEHRDRCHSISEAAEPHIEDWWAEGDPESDDIFEYLCIEKLKSCCPPRHYGENCQPCKGDGDAPCSGNGRCKGDGTRKGNGECACDPGYDGQVCEKCAVSYYQSYRDDKKTVCSPCHKACKGGCDGSGVTGCKECHKGWRFDLKNGCIDIDECAAKSFCTGNQFCVNEEGSFKCLACDRSCDGCKGDGPDMCSRCAAGYQLKDKLCVDSDSVKISERVTFTRYLTYFGLCVTICIIFQKSTILAGVLGLLVGLYISVSEYMLANDMVGPSPMIDPSKIDFSKLFGKDS